MLSLERTSFN